MLSKQNELYETENSHIIAMIYAIKSLQKCLETGGTYNTCIWLKCRTIYGNLYMS